MEGRVKEAVLKRLLKVVACLFLWFILFWTFLVVGFPEKTTKDWIADRIEKGLRVKVSIRELHLMWNLCVNLKEISITSREPGAFNVRLASLNLKPKSLSLIRLRPEIDFNGDTPSGGLLSGSYVQEQLSISFKNVSLNDLNIPSLPFPSSAKTGGTGRFKLTKGKGAIDIEIDGIPGGKQRAKTPGGENPGLDGEMRVTVFLPKM